MFFKKIIIATFLMVPCTVYAAVTVFDEQKGQDVEAELQDGKLERLPELKIQQAPRQTDRDSTIETPVDTVDQEPAYIAPTISPSDIELLPWEVENYDLGHAQIFIDAREFDKTLAKSIMKIQDIEGLRVNVYVKAPKNFLDIGLLAIRGLLKSPGIEFKTDSRDKKFKKLGLQEYATVHYTSPFGDMRAFSLKQPEYVFNKVDYVRRQVRGQ